MQQEVLLRQTLDEKIVNHVFRSELKLHTSLPCLFQLFESVSQVLCLVRDILHNVRSTPEFAHSGLLHQCQNLERLFQCPDTVIHAI